MTKNKFHLTDNYHVIYLGEISWKVSVTPQVNTHDMQFIIIVTGPAKIEHVGT